MKRVMIVDDEKLIRDGIAQLIDWNHYGYEVVFRASDGKRALEYLEEQEVHVILTDIRMPFLDGIELAKIIRRAHPAISIVFVSGYDDFALVRDALQLGACDYLLKPLEPPALIEVLGRLGREMEQREMTEVELTKLRNDAEQALEMRKQKQLKQLALGHMNRPHDAQLFLLETQETYGLIVVEIDRYFIKYGNLRAEQLDIVREQLWEEVRLIFPKDVTVFELGEGTYGLYVCLPLHEIDSYCEALAQRKVRLEKLDDTLTLFYGGHTRDVAQLAGLYRNAMHLREQRFAELSHTINDQEHPQASTIQDDGLQLSSACDAVVKAVELADESLLDAQMTKLATVLCNQGGRSFLYAQVMYANLFAQATRDLIGEGAAMSEVFPDPMESYRVVSNSQTLRQATEQMRQLLKAVVDYRLMRKSGTMKAQIMKAKRYVDLHLDDVELCMQSVATQFSMSTSYFSTEFRKTLGYTFTDYLMMARMQRASDLLQHSQLKIYEIARNVGYENTTYFSTLFKRHFGVSPKQFRA